MSRPKKSFPTLRRQKSKGRPDRAFVAVNGKREYLGRWGSNTIDIAYAKFLAEWAASDGRIPGRLRESTTLVELITAYMKYARGYYQKDRQETKMVGHAKSVLRIVRQLYGSTLVPDFGIIQLKAVRETMIEQGLARSTINYRIGIVRRMFKWAVTEGMATESVYRTLTCLPDLKKGRSRAPEMPPVKPIDDETVGATLGHCPPIVAAMVRIQRLTGCRPGEIVIIRPIDIDRTGEVWLYTPESHKTEHLGKSRTVYIGPKVQAILTPYLDRHETDYCFDPKESEALRLLDRRRERKTPLSYGNRPGTNRKRKPKVRPGSRYTTSSYRRAIYRACDKAGVEQWGPNRLRHTAATEIRREHGLEAAQVILGHSTANVTQVYAERDTSKAIEIAREVG
jgi:integrase